MMQHKEPSKPPARARVHADSMAEHLLVPRPPFGRVLGRSLRQSVVKGRTHACSRLEFPTTHVASRPSPALPRPAPPCPISSRLASQCPINRKPSPPTSPKLKCIMCLGLQLLPLLQPSLSSMDHLCPPHHPRPSASRSLLSLSHTMPDARGDPRARQERQER